MRDRKLHRHPYFPAFTVFLALMFSCNSPGQPGINTAPATSTPLPTNTVLPTAPSTAVPPVETAFTDEGRVLYIDSGEVKVGVDMDWGGAIREIWYQGENIVNNYDGGRLIGVSLYDSRQPPASSHPNDTGWNPTPSDWYNNINRPLRYSFTDNTLYILTRQIQWYPDDKGGGRGKPVASDVLAETWIEFYGNAETLHIRYKLSHQGQDFHAAASQEFPFAYTRTPYNRFVSYTGSQPWTRRDVQIQDISLNRTGSGQAVATEHWAGFVNAEDIGLVLWAPQNYANFSYGWFNNPGPAENSTLYLLPHTYFEIGPRANEEIEVFLFAGRWPEARDRIYFLNQSLGFADVMPPFGIGDTTRENQSLSGTFLIDGWAIDNVGVTRIEIRLDGRVIGLARYGNPRHDVDRDYPGLPGAPSFGFFYELDTTALANGAHTFEILAFDAAGNINSILPGAVSVNINN